MARGLIDVFKDYKKNKEKQKIQQELNDGLNKEKNISKQNHSDTLSKINEINRKADKIIMLGEPEIYTLAKENNIACKYGDNTIITKDGNATIAVELKGISYAGISLDDETDYLLNRVMFFTTLKNDVEINLIIKKEKKENKKSIQRDINIYCKSPQK